MKLAIFWIVTLLSCCKCSPVDEKKVLADIKQLDSNRDIPALFKRTYVEWLGETTCISQSLKSSEAEIKQKGPLRFSMKARISARTGNPLMKVELWLEFYNLTRTVNKSNRYEAIIRPIDSEIQSTNQTSPEPVISEEGRLVEISFNVTDIYYTSKALGKKHVNFRINIRGNTRRATKELHGSTDIKAFLIIKEYEEICNDYFPIRQPERFKRTLDLVNRNIALKYGGVYLSGENVHPLYYRRPRKSHPIMNTMVSILHDIASTNILIQSHLQQQSSRVLLKNSQSLINTRTLNRKNHKEKHFRHDPESRNMNQSSHRDIMDTSFSNMNPFQRKANNILHSTSNINVKMLSGTTAKKFNNSHEELQTRDLKLNTLRDVSTRASDQVHHKKNMLKTSDTSIWRADRTFVKNFNNSHQPTLISEPTHLQDIKTDTSTGLQTRFPLRNNRNVLKALHPNSDINTRTSCGLKDWYVSFEHIGWDSWVIAPAGVRAKACSGVCSFPLGNNINSTAHAHLQSFVYYFMGEKWPACCVPNEFDPLTMVLYDVADGLHFMAKYPNMIATSCACL